MLIPSHLTITTLWPGREYNCLGGIQHLDHSLLTKILLPQMVVHVSFFSW